jgi:hypothetical protein
VLLVRPVPIVLVVVVWLGSLMLLVSVVLTVLLVLVVGCKTAGANLNHCSAIGRIRKSSGIQRSNDETMSELVSFGLIDGPCVLRLCRITAKFGIVAMRKFRFACDSPLEGWHFQRRVRQLTPWNFRYSLAEGTKNPG